MPVIESRSFDHYSINYYTEHDSNYLAIILCKKVKEVVGTIYFLESHVSLPPAELRSDGSIHLYYFEKSVPTVLNILQNEGPLKLFFNSIVKTGWISTNDEPVGEEES